jgi:hypothetical protein
MPPPPLCFNELLRQNPQASSVMHSSLLFLSALATLASAKRCQNATVPVQITSRQGVFGDVAVPQTNLEAQIFIQNQTVQGRNFTAVGLTDYATVSGTYNISAMFCMPDSMNSSSPSLQILTHGIGFDKTRVPHLCTS